MSEGPKREIDLIAAARGMDDDTLAPMGAPGEGRLSGWESYSQAELRTVLDHYQLGDVAGAQEYRRGSRSAPKLKIRADSSAFLLKRRSTQRHPESRIRFGQALQARVQRDGVPVAELIRTREGDTLLLLEDRAYELFRFIDGQRYGRTETEASRAGECLARLHTAANGGETAGAPPASFHASDATRIAIARCPDAIAGIELDADRADLDALAQALGDIYDRATEEVQDLGFARLERRLVHGDWHPGNLIWRDRAVVAVVDFDSARVEPIATEVANGVLQFSIRAVRGQLPHLWPDDLDAARMKAFLRGYESTAAALTPTERHMLPWLMIEAMIVESAIPVANQGTFADIPGSGFLRLVWRKCEWVRQHRKAIAELD